MPNTVGPEPVTIGCSTPDVAQRLERRVDRGAQRAGGGLEVVDVLEVAGADALRGARRAPRRVRGVSRASNSR